MVNYFHRHLSAKLFLSYLVIILIGVIVLIIASQFILPGSFSRHMANMSMAGGMMEGMMGPGDMGNSGDM